jgi:galactose mutarotase-like enzyme
MNDVKTAQRAFEMFPNDVSISQSHFKGLESVVLENNCVRAEWIPSYGGKMVSLIAKSGGGHELLYQTPLTKLVCPSHGADFGLFDTSGFDECFPSIEECQVEVEEDRAMTSMSIPDHGDVWSLPWKYHIAPDGSLMFSVTSALIPYQLTKKVTLEKNELIINYSVELTATVTAMPFLWTPHALFSYQPDTTIVIPKRLNSITSVCPVGRLQDVTKRYTYPKHTLTDGIDWDGSVFAVQDEGLCEKFYFDSQLNNGDWFGFQDSRCRLMMNVDANVAPYLGIWKNQGAHNNTHNFALEPCSGIYDSAQKAQINGTVANVTSQLPSEWYLRIKID